MFAQLYHAPGRGARRATPVWTAVLEGIEACRSVQRFCPTATSLEAQDAPGNVRRKAASWAGGLCAASNLRTRNAGPVPASSRRQDRWQGRRLRVWDSTVGRGRQHPEGQTQNCHRRCSKRCSQAASESRREKPGAKRLGRFSNSGPRLPGFRGTPLSSRKIREFRPYNVQELSERPHKDLRRSSKPQR